MLLLGGLLAGVGCRSRPARVGPFPPDAVILAFGDSLTCGVGATESESYPSVLARLTGLEVINAGVPGEVSTAGMTRIRTALERHKPALVILCHGGNDLIQGGDEATLIRNLKSMARAIRDGGAKTILIGVPRPGLLLRVPVFYEQIADEFGLPYDGEVVRGILSSPALKSDMIHPNPDGYRKLAEAVAAMIAPAPAR